MPRSPFRVLAREFFDQFFVNESGVSDLRHRQAMVGVLAFLVTPGFMVSLQLIGAFEMAYIRFPELIEPMTRLVATLFLAYGMVVIGVVGAYAWDALGFDRRDAMVIGPLPMSGAAVVGAKLAAMGALLGIAMAGIDLTGAVPFAMIASSHKPPLALLRHLVAHIAATTLAVAFVFSVLVTLRAAAAMVRTGRAAVESLLQFTLVSALLCFMALTPGALHLSPGRHGARGAVHMMPIPVWSPTNWFLGIYEVLRGTNDGEFTRAAWIAVLVTLAALATAIGLTTASYRRQLRFALSPSADGGLRAAALPRLIARLLVGRHAVTRATADFLIVTIARNRAQQTPIALNAAIGLALVVIAVSRFGGTLAALGQLRPLTLAVPLVLTFWTMIGLRAAFFVPSELRAAWTFRVNAPVGPRAYRRAVCASLVAVVAPPAVALAVLTLLPTRDLAAIGRHAVFVGLLVVALAEVLGSTIDFIPFTRPYRAGHAKLRTLWPVYALGMYLFADVAARLELWTWRQDHGFTVLIASMAGTIAVLELAGRVAAARWPAASLDDVTDDDENSVIALDLSAVSTGW